ncbi:MAG: heavy metal translocating p-type atpase, partial [bacterium]
MKINPKNSSDSLHRVGTHGHDHGAAAGHRHSHGGDGRRPGPLPEGHAADEDDHGDHDDHDHAQPGDLLRIGCVAAAIAVGGSGIARGLAPFDLFSLGATLGGGLPIFQHALQALRRRRMTMELSMTVALAAAMVIGELFTSAVIVLFVLIAEVLEGLTVSRGRSAIQDLLVYLPRNTRVKRGEEWVTVSVDTLTVGDVVLVRPG